MVSSTLQRPNAQHLASSAPPPAAAHVRRRRLHALGLAAISILFHLYLAGWLAAASRGLDPNEKGDDAGLGGGDDARDWEGAERRRVEGVRALLGIAKLWAQCSVGVAAAGLFGILRDKLSFIRLFMLNGFLSLSLDLVLLSTIFLILTVGNPSASSGESGLATTVCQALSSSAAATTTTSRLFPLSIGLPDMLGVSLEACEEQFEGVLITALGSLALVEGARAWLAIRILGYYAMLVRSRLSPSARSALRGGHEGVFTDDAPLEMDFAAVASSSASSSAASGQQHSGPAHLGSQKKKHRRESHGSSSHTEPHRRSSHPPPPLHRERSGSGRTAGDKKRSGDETRIFLLPRSDERNAPPYRTSPSQKQHKEVPLLSLTTSSPVSTTFPPMRPAEVESSTSGGKVLVYAPVLVSPEEARSLGATEVLLGSHQHHHRCRGDSQPGQLPSHRHHEQSRRRDTPPASDSSTTPVRSRSSTITPGSSTTSRAEDDPEATPRLGASLGSPVKTSSPLRPSMSSRAGSTVRNASLTIDAALSRQGSPAPQSPVRQDSMEDATTPVASSSGYNIAMTPSENKGRKLA